jgi:uncharacterized protein YrrD
MEISFCELKQKDVISVVDGKNLGRVVDVTLSFPENHILGFSSSGGKGIRLFKQEMYFSVCCIVRVGEDAVLIKPPAEQPNNSCKRKKRERSAPQYQAQCQPECEQDCQPETKQNSQSCQQNHAFYGGNVRRDFDEYE